MLFMTNKSSGLVHGVYQDKYGYYLACNGRRVPYQGSWVYNADYKKKACKFCMSRMSLTDIKKFATTR